MELTADSELREQAHLSAGSVALTTLCRIQHLVEAVQLPEPRSEFVARTRLDERLDHALVGALQVQAVAEIVERAERPAGLTGLDNSLGRAFADVFHGAQAKADARWGDRKVELRLVHVRRKHRDLHAPAFGDRDRDWVWRSHFGGEHGGQ